MALMPINALALEVSVKTGLRIGDVLALKRADVAKGRFTLHEEKTGKSRRITVPKALQARLLQQNPVSEYCFPGARSIKKHRTRQAVYIDLKRVAKAFKIATGTSPHSMRKVYAVNELKRSKGQISAVQSKLNHSSPEITLLYALSDKMNDTKFRLKI
jgi:integrase